MVKWTDHATTQLQHIHTYISQGSPLYARLTIEKIVRKTIGLDKLPRKGRKLPELNQDTIRELGIFTYRIIYQIKPAQRVDILAVIHKRQQLDIDDIPLND